MRTYPQLLGRGLRRSFALVCVLIVLGFAALEGLHSHSASLRARGAQETPCWVCHVGHSANLTPHVALTGLCQVCVDLTARPGSHPLIDFDEYPEPIRPPPVL